jgi:hypothetical protein
MTLEQAKLEQLESKLGEEEKERATYFAERLDFLDIQILREFYMTGDDFPLDSQPHCFPILYRNMKTNHRLKIGAEALRKRINRLAKNNFIEKIDQCNPTNYLPVPERAEFVRAIILKFFLLNGLNKFL